MGEPQRREVAVLRRKSRKARDQRAQGADEEGEALSEEDEVCVAASMGVNIVVAWVLNEETVKLTQ